MTVFTWSAGDGTSTADWTGPANWDQGASYPQAGDTAIFPSGKHKCYVNAAITCYDVTLTGDAADTVLELQANLEVTHDLLITSGIMNLGASAYTLTVGGDIYLTPVGAGTGTNATLTCGDADITVTGKLNTAGVWHSGGYNPKSIFTGGTGDHTFASMHLLAGTDVVLSSGVTEITGNVASAAFRPDVNTTYNTYSNGSGTVKFTSASAQNMYSPGAAASAYKQFYNLILEKTSSTLQCLSTVGFDIRVENNLTITSGILNTNTTTGVNFDLTVTGNVSNYGTLTLNASTFSAAFLRNYSTGVVPASTGEHTFTDALRNDNSYTFTNGNTLLTGRGVGNSGYVLDDQGSTMDYNGGTINIGNGTDIGGNTNIRPQASHDLNDLIINCTNSRKVILATACDIAGNLTITAGELDTGADLALTVTGQCAVAGTLTCNASTVSVGSGLTNTLGMLVQSGGTLTGGSGAHTYGTFNADASGTVNVTLTSDITTINGSYSDGIAFAMRSGVTFSAGGGDIHFTLAGNQYIYERNNTARTLGDVVVNKSSGTLQWYNGGGAHYTMASLTITAGTFATNEITSGTSKDLTVQGQTYIDTAGVLSCGASTMSLGQTDLSPADSSWGLYVNGGILYGGTGTHTISSIYGAAGTVTLTSGNTTLNGFNTSSASPLKVIGSTTFAQTAGKVIFNGANQQSIHLQRSIQFHDVQWSHASEMKIFNWGTPYTITVTGTLEIDASSTFSTEYVGGGAANDNPLLVTEGATIGGTLNCYGNGGGKAASFGSLTINSGGTYKATSGTTTITGESSGGYAINDDGMLTPNGGTIEITTPETTNIDPTGGGSGAIGVYHNLILNPSDGSSDIYLQGHLTLTGNLTIKSGGGEGAVFRSNAKNVVIDGIVTNEGGTITAGSDNMTLGGIRNLGAYTGTGTLTITGTGGIIEGNLGAANVNVNLDPALLIDAAEDKITTGNLGSLGQATSISSFAWVKFAVTPSTSQYIWSTGYNPCNFYMGGTNKLGFQGKMPGSPDTTASVVMSGTHTFETGVWYHIGFSYDNSSRAVLFYINGVEYAGGTFPSALKDVNTDLILGNYGAGTNMIEGNLADVKIFNTVVNEAGAKILASKINQEPTTTAYNANVIGWWKINEGSASIADFTNETNGGTDHDGTLANGSWENDVFSVNVQDGLASAGGTTTTGTFTATQGTVEGLSLSSCEFDGTGDYVDVGELGDYAAISVGLWVKPDDAGGDMTSQGIVGFEGNQNGIATGAGANKLRIKYETLSPSSHIDADYTWVQNTWQHIGFTYDGATIRIYVNGVEIDSVAATGTWGTSSTDIGSLVDTTWPYDGEIRDVRLYDYGLSGDQMASLYSKSYNVTPKHWYKMDEGTGSTANDTGTATPVNGTLNGNASLSDTNGTLDLDGTLTIAANGTLSAPRGDLSLAAGTTFAANTFTHNNGRVVLTNAGTVEYNFSSDHAGSDNPLYDLQNQAAGQSRFTAGYIIENSHSFSGGNNYNYLTGGRQYNYGTTSSAAAITARLRVALSGGDNIAHVYGVSSLYPVTMNNWDDLPMSYDVTIKNMNITTDVTSNSIPSGRTVTLDGDCEFGAFTVEAGGTLDLNGQRMECSGTLSVPSGGILDADGLLYVPIMDIDGATPLNVTSGDVVLTGSGTVDFENSSGLYRTIMFNGTGKFQPNNSHMLSATNVIIANEVDCNDVAQTNPVNITVPTGGTLDGDSATLTVAGDFTTSGGLIGKTGIYNNGIYNAQFPASADQNPIYGSGHNFTVEGWWKFDSFGYNVPARSANTGTWMLLNNTTVLEFSFSAFDGSTVSLTAPSWTSLGISTNEWVHIAGVCDGTSQKLYINGKLVKEGTKSLGVGNGSGLWAIGSNPNSTAYVFDGHNHMLRMWREARTVTELRDNMFTTTPTDSNSKLTANINYLAGGSGGTITDAAGNGNGVMYKTGHVTTTDAAAWAGAGTLNWTSMPSSNPTAGTLDMRGPGTLTVPSAAKIFNLTVGTTGQVTLAGNPYIYGLLTVDSNGITDGSTNRTIGIVNLTPSLHAGVNFSAINQIHYQTGGDAITIYPTTYDICRITASSQATLVGALDATTLQVDGSCSLTATDTTITTRGLRINGSDATLDIAGTTVTLTDANPYGFTGANSTTTLSAGPATNIIGHADRSIFYSQNNFVVVGNIENLDVTNEELSILGNVTNCTGEIHRWNPTIDTNQMLDADTADDRDVRLGSDLDRNTELVT